MRRFGLILFLALLGGCAGEMAYREGQALLDEGRWEEGLARMEQAAGQAPVDSRFRVGLINRRAELVNRLVAQAANEQGAGRLDVAEVLYRRAQGLDPSSERVRSGLALLERDRRHALLAAEAREALKRGEGERVQRAVEAVLSQNPAQAEMLAIKRLIDEERAREASRPPGLGNAFRRPLTVEFRDANLRLIFEALSRTTGISFILDKDVRADARATIFLRDAPLEDAIDLILQSNSLQKKVLSASSVIIYPATPEKLKEYQDLIVRTFYLSNADVKQTAQLLRSIIKLKDIFIDEKVGMLVIRDTADAVRLAERLVALHDVGEAEAMLEVEVLEVQRTRLLELGIRFPDAIGLTILPPAAATTLRLSDLRSVNSDRLQAAVGGTTINFRRELGDVNLLANPRIRVKSREKARFLIGDRVPVITTVTTATGFASESIQYAEVGLKVEVEPQISPRDEVTIRVGMEVSSIAREVTTRSGSLAYQIGTRNANTVLKLKDGETQVLAGLISNEERSSANRLPGLGDLPGVGRLFGSTRDNNARTEIVLSITPRLIRNLDRLDAFAEEFYSGTETTLRTRPISLQAVGAQAAAGAGPGAASTAVGSPSVASSSAPAPGATPAPGVAAVQRAGTASPGSGSVFVGQASPQEAVPPKPLPAVTLDWQAPTQAKVGETVQVAVRVKSEGALRSLPLQVTFNPAVLQAVEVREGGFFRQEGGRTSFASNMDNTRGRVLIGTARSEGTAKGEETLATIAFRVLAAGRPADVRILMASPVGAEGVSASATLPAPLGLNLSN